MRPEERANIMKTLKELTDKISLLQNDMTPTALVSNAMAPPNHSQTKSKIDVSVCVWCVVCVCVCVLLVNWAGPFIDRLMDTFVARFSTN